MRYPRPKRASFEGRFLVESLDADGTSRRYFADEADLAKAKAPGCGPYCHPPGSLLVIGRVEGGRINGEPLETFVGPLAD